MSGAQGRERNGIWSGPGISQGRLDASGAPRIGEKEPDGKALLSQISKFTAYKFCFP